MQINIDDNSLEKQSINIFKALADPVRLAIIRYLNNSDQEVACGEVGKAINISKSSGSYHFKLLQDAGLITARKEAREKYVRLNYQTFDKFVIGFFDNI